MPAIDREPAQVFNQSRIDSRPFAFRSPFGSSCTARIRFLKLALGVPRPEPVALIIFIESVAMKHSATNLLDHLPAEIIREADRIAADLTSRLERARDHVLDPDKHRLSTDPLEQKLAKSLGKLKGRLGKRAAKAVASLKPGKRLPFPERGVTAQQVEAAAQKLMSGDLAAFAQPTPRAIVSHALNINNLLCVQDTIEPGKDDMVIGTVATALRVLADGTISTVVVTKQTDLGKFAKGDNVPFNPPKAIASFANVETPTVLSVHLVLAETDVAGGVNAVLKDLVDGVENRLNGKQFTALFSSAAALVAVYPVGAAIFGGAAVTLGTLATVLIILGLIMLLAAVVAALLLALFHLFRDEIFPTQSVALALDAAGAVEGGTTAPIDLRFSRNVAVYDAQIQFT
jgi:hypothetical protein